MSDNNVQKYIPVIALIVAGAFVLNNQISRVTEGVSIKRKDEGTVGLGGPCSNFNQCMADGVTPGVGAGLSDQISCCSGVCRMKVKGGAGIYWCPEDQPNIPPSQVEKTLIEENKQKGRKVIDICDNNTVEIEKSCNRDEDCSYNGIPCQRSAGGLGSTVRCHPGRKKCEFLKRQTEGIGTGSYWFKDECRKTGFFGSDLGSCVGISPEEEQYNKWKKEQNEKKSIANESNSERKPYKL